MIKFFIAISITLAFLNAAFAQRMYDGSDHQIGRVDGERYYDGSGQHGCWGAGQIRYLVSCTSDGPTEVIAEKFSLVIWP